MIKKILAIMKESLPVLGMIICIPLIANDYILASVYAVIIGVLLVIKREKNDLLVLVIGFVAMTIFETIFITTGVEVFLRKSLFGIMPLWLPFLWSYGFVVIKRSLSIFNK